MRISVVTPAYNAVAFIADAIGSVLGQTHRELRHIVVDDGSTDGTDATVSRFADPRLILIRQPNAGVSAARNRGAAAADGDALLFLDADDWLAPTALTTLSAALEAAPAAVAAVGPYARVDPSGPAIERRRTRASATPRDLLPRLLVQNQFANPGHVLIRRDAALRAGVFCPDIAYGEDWEYVIRIALQGPFAYAPARQPLLFIRSRADGAYRRLAANPDAFIPCMNAIFGNAALLQRFDPARFASLRRRAEAENQWIIGRELMRRGDMHDGRRWLRRSVAAAPGAKRLMLLAAAHLLPWVPAPCRGPFRPYPPAAAKDHR